MQNKSTAELTVSVITDYGPLSDMAFAEVTQRIYHEMGDLASRVKEYSVPAFDTVQTGFMLAQTAVNSLLSERHFFYVNTAPRHDDANPRKDSAGEKLVYLELENGVRILAVNSGYSLSFVKAAAKTIRVVKIENAGSQFRSRDFYPKVLGRIANGDDSLITDSEPYIPDPPENAVGFIDGYGNIKTTMSPAVLEKHDGEFAAVEINGHRHFARIGQSIFDVPDGYLCMAKGSSGWVLPDGTQRSFVEIVRRSGSAYQDFGGPAGGSGIEWHIES